MEHTNLETIYGLIKEKKQPEALRALTKLDVEDKATAESLYLSGLLYHQKNQFNKAVQAFQRSLLLNPNFTDSAISLSIIYNDTGHYKKAKNVFNKAKSRVRQNGKIAPQSIVIDKELSRKHRKLGDFYRKVQRLNDATKEYFKAAHLDPQSLTVRLCLAKAFLQNGETKLAQKELEKLTQEHPTYCPARIQLALLLFSNEKNIEAAHTQLTSVLKMEPKNQEAQTYLNIIKKTRENSATNPFTED